MLFSFPQEGLHQPISNELWMQPTDVPVVHFSIAHNNLGIYLKFDVTEKHIRSVVTEINGAVWEDSCVEFFIRFNNNEAYYNFEYNSICTGLIGYGTGKNNRVLLDAAVVKKIEACTTLSANQELKTWSLLLFIPVEVFVFDDIKTLQGQSATANFYKCGDLLPQPHFLSWKKIESEEPNFHLPQYFGEISFT
jgi:hypothetical protein